MYAKEQRTDKGAVLLSPLRKAVQSHNETPSDAIKGF